jgi:hypothetical protein
MPERFDEDNILEAEDRSSRFVSDGSGITMTQCLSCIHLVKGSRTCKAFPSQIPEEIIENRFDHRRPYPDDEGIRFEPRPGVPEAYLTSLYKVLDEDHEDV